MPWYVCRDQRTTCGSGFSPSTTWVSGAGFTCIGLKVSTFFHSLSHLASLTLFFKTGFLGGTLDLPIHLSWLVTKSRRSTCLCLSYSPRIHLSLPLPPCPQDPPVSAPPIPPGSTCLCLFCSRITRCAMCHPTWPFHRSAGD